MAEEPPPPKHRDAWDKAEIILKPIGGLLTALAVALLGYVTSPSLLSQLPYRSEQPVIDQLHLRGTRRRRGKNPRSLHLSLPTPASGVGEN